ncbi:hypothetical protein [Nocardia flavorosea]|uniref:hypothetical protein n=1 Tax=Nocardia flavorosea TaxID=53429 RepID=UPI002454C283|nr:hypothetical protein [Nocardia flavorosea]
MPDENKRRTFRATDEEWNAAAAVAARNGETLAAVLRRFLVDYTMGQASGLDGYSTEYRATSVDAVGDAPHVLTGLTGPLDEVRRLYPATRWRLEERDVSPYRPIKRRD